MSPIKDFNLIYGALNKENTVSQGDTIAGSVTFTLTKETKVKKLVVKAKGEARVHWSEGTGDRRRSYNAYRRYLKLKEFLVAENDKGTVLPKGDHHFKFQFTIPQGDMPSSLKVIHGNIVYKLEAKMSRSWRMSSGVAKELNFVSKSFSPPGQVMAGSVDKKMSGFSEGQVQMSATVNPSVCSPETSGLKIQNKLLVKCLQVQRGPLGGRVSLGDCSPHSVLQEWRWLPESQALSSQHTGECLTAPGEQYEGVHLQPCIVRPGRDITGAGVAAVDSGREASSQSWFCSKKGHLTLLGRGLHLSATQESTLVFLSKEHKQPGTRWRTLDNQTLCNGRDNQLQPHNNLGKSLEPGSFPRAISDIKAEPFEGIMAVEVTETYPVVDVPLASPSTKSPADPTMVFYSLDYGMGWKITMLVLSSLALVLGTVILILNVYSNRRKKVVCILKSYTPRPEVSVPGSPVASERAPLTEHAMRLPHSSPTLQRGEILIEWKDGTVTPLYEA